MEKPEDIVEKEEEKQNAVESEQVKHDEETNEKKKREKKPPLYDFMLIIAVCLVVGTIKCLSIILPDIANRVRSKGREQVIGYIDSADIYNVRYIRYMRGGDSHRIQDCDLTVKYLVDNHTYTLEVYIGNDDFDYSEPVTVYYDKDNPKDAVTDISMKRIPPFWARYIFIGGVIGLIFYLKNFKILPD